MGEMEITYRGSVFPTQCDHMGHMNVQYYVGKFDEGTWNFFNSLGISPTYLRDNNCGMAAVDQHLTYSAELMPGDLISVRTQLIELGGKKIRFRHEMVNGETGKTAATCELLAVHMDTNARKATPFPDDIIANAHKRLKMQASHD